jgi:hypothetical protein
MMLAVSLSYIAFIMLRYIPSIPSFLRALIMKWCWTLSKALFCVRPSLWQTFLNVSWLWWNEI